LDNISYSCEHNWSSVADTITGGAVKIVSDLTYWDTIDLSV